jgi:NAD(P)-dependent dehydrogenase (short-subunit alcohol dehydrogenase family)
LQTLEDQRVVITGGSRGLGLGAVEALVERRARVTVLARDVARLAEVRRRLGVEIIAGDICDPELPDRVVREVRPSVLILNAGTTPPMAPIHEQSWEGFSATWNTDVKAGLAWIQAALRVPLPRESRVLLVSSGAAVAGSPLSGGHAGAKRMLWLMAHYANLSAAELDTGIRFQAVIPQQIIGETEHGRVAGTAYANKKGITLEAFLRGFGEPLTPRRFGEHLVTLLTEPTYETGTAFGVKGTTGLLSLDG